MNNIKPYDETTITTSSSNQPAATAARPPSPTNIGIAAPTTAKAKPDWLMTGDELDSQVYEPLKYVVDDLLPTGLAILSAQPKIGKSFMVLQIALAIANGEKFLGKNTLPGEVLFFGLEDDNRRIQVRSRRLNRNSPLPDTFHLHNGTDLSLEVITERIDKWVEFADNPRLVVIDTLGRAAPPKGNRDPYEHVTSYLGPLQLKAKALDVTILVVHHNRKSKETSSGDPVEQLLGTTALSGAGDSILVLQRERGNKHGQLQVFGRDTEDDMGMDLVWDNLVWRLKDEPDTLQHKLGIAFRPAQILEAIHTGFTKSRDIAAVLGLKQNQVANNLKALREAGHIHRVSGYDYELLPNTLKIVQELANATPQLHPTEDGDPEITTGVDTPGPLDVDPMRLPSLDS